MPNTKPNTMLDAIENRITDHVLSLRALCKTAEDAADRSDETTYRETVEKITDERAELQAWYAHRRALAAKHEEAA